MEGKFPSGFDADTWEITEELYFEIFEMVRISSRAKNTTGVFP